MNIIIADDDKELCHLMKIFLELKGHQVFIDSNAYLLNDLQGKLPDMIFIDINLQNADGGDLCTRLKSEMRTKAIPIILISAIMDLKNISQLVGADGYLIKPFHIPVLDAIVSKHIKVVY